MCRRSQVNNQQVVVDKLFPRATVVLQRRRQCIVNAQLLQSWAKKRPYDCRFRYSHDHLISGAEGGLRLLAQGRCLVIDVDEDEEDELYHGGQRLYYNPPVAPDTSLLRSRQF